MTCGTLGEGRIDWPRVRDATRRTALVHDFLVSVRGADRVFLEICNLWPDADIFTTVYNEQGTEGRFAHRRIQTSFLQRLRPSARTFRALLPLYPDRDRVLRPVRLRPRRVELERLGARGRLRRAERARVLLPQPVPLRMERAPPHDRRAGRPGLARLPARPLPALARVGLDRRPARRPLHHELAHDAGAHPQLLRPRLARRLPAGRHWALPPGPRRAQLPDRLRARLAQADRHRRRGLQPAAAAARDRGRRPRPRAGSSGSRARRSGSPGGFGRRRRPT